VNGSEDVAMVSHGDSGHIQRLHTFTEIGNVAGAVQHGVIAMKVKMNEVRHWCTSILLWEPRMREEKSGGKWT
jgi:hypothetical protein